MNKLKSQSLLSNFIFIIGSYYALKSILSILCWTKQYFFTFEKDFKKVYGDGWVVITGASDGIGKQFAIEFAKKGHKLVLIARSEEKLQKVCSEVKAFSSNNSEINYIVYDFDRSYNESDVKELNEKLYKYINDISILINNLGLVDETLILKFH